MIACTIANGAAVEEVRTRFEAVADAGQVGRFTVAHCDDVVRSGKHVHFTELDGLGLIDGPRGTQHEEQHVAVALQFGSLMSLHRVLYRERVKVELFGNGGELRRVGAVQTDPCDSLATTAGGVECPQALGRSEPFAVTIDRAVNDHGLGLRPLATAGRHDRPTRERCPPRSRPISSEVSVDSVGRGDPALVLGCRPQDHDLGRDTLEQPLQVIATETDARAAGG